MGLDGQAHSSMTLLADNPSRSRLSQFLGDHPVLISALILAASPLWQLRFGVNGDASWIITMCERILAGDRLYVDLIETNPPFTIWMFMPAVLLARWFGMTPESVLLAYTYGVCLFGLGLAAMIVDRAGLRDRDVLRSMLPVFTALLFIFPSNSFAEREHLATALLLPLIALIAWRAEKPDDKIGLVWPVLAGLSGSVIVLVKPYYALMILLPVLWIAWKRRSLTIFLSPELWIIGLLSVAYLAAVTIIYPEFLNDIYPLLRVTYMRLTRPAFTFQMYSPMIAIMAYLIYNLGKGRAISSLTTIAILASIGGFVSLFYQSKGWAYHAYPSYFLIISVLVSVLLRRMQSDDGERLSLVGILLVPGAVLAASVPFQMHYSPDASLVERVRAVAPAHPKVALIGSGIEAGHPFARMIGGRWIGSHCSDWLGGFATGWAAVDEMDGYAQSAAHYTRIADEYSEEKITELKSGNPDILILQKGDSLWIEPFIGRPGMSGFMDRYSFVGDDKMISVYQLKPEHRL